MTSTVRYFAYGSNLDAQRMLGRVPSAQSLCLASLQGYRFAFNMIDPSDGAVYANINWTGDSADVCYGFLYLLQADELHLLDRAEDLGTCYSRELVEVDTDEGRRTAYVYVGLPQTSAKEPIGAPFDWYKDLIVWGARRCGLPESYITSTIAVAAATEDPDEMRAARNRRKP